MRQHTPAYASARPHTMAANFDWKAHPDFAIELWDIAADKVGISVDSFWEEFSKEFRLWAQAKLGYQQKIGNKIRKERQAVWGPLKEHGQEYSQIPRGTRKLSFCGRPAKLNLPQIRLSATIRRLRR